ncbi:MAG: sugar MFS transporter [Rhizobacter sp.]|nr:sugar MFS transporter [Chlorobiales bacterium]
MATQNFAAEPNTAAVSSGRLPDAEVNYTPAMVVVTSLFFMIGFITCLNDILIPHLKGVFELSYVQAALIQFTFFSAYFVMSWPSGKILSLFGYKRGMVIGLITAGVGTLLFYPAAATFSYPLFLGALFVLASGFTLLQVAVNPYVAVLGKPETASSRLNLTQAFNSVGTTIAPWFGGLLILTAATKTAEQLKAMPAADWQAYKVAEASSVQVPYLGLAAALFLLAAAIAWFKLPVIAAVEGEEARQGSFMDAIKIPHLSLGALGIFVYVGAEVAIGSFLVNFIGLPEVAGLPEAAAAKFVSYYWGGAMIGRFIGSAILQKFSPGKLLGIFSIVAAALVLVGAFTSGGVAMWAIIAIGFFNSIMFPTIFTLGIDGLGKLTSQGSSVLIAAIVGGALIPLLMGKLADSYGLHAAYILPAICYLYIAYYGFKGSQHSLGNVHALNK